MKVKNFALGLAAASIALNGIAADKTAYKYPFQDPDEKLENRIENLLSLLTPEEKVSMMMNRSMPIERLEIPGYNWWGEACHGLMGMADVTVYPQSIAMASSFDDENIFKTYNQVSDEARARWNNRPKDRELDPYVAQYNLSFWAPNVNLIRDPRWGRGQESFGEDPYLLGRMGVNVVKGMQNPKDGQYKTHACAKHYAVHSGPEPKRHQFNAVVSERDLWESYLPAFKALVQEGNVQEVMCAYSAVDGDPCCSNERLQIQILRDKWGYEGIVLTDCDAINDLFNQRAHGTHANAVDASSDAVISGANLECGRAYNNLVAGLQQGKIKESDLDAALRYVLRGRFTLGLLDPDECSPFYNIPKEVIDCQEHRDQALLMAHESSVLLKNNNNILPLSKDLKTIAVVGPNIDDEVMMRGNYSGTPTHCTTILKGIQNKLPNTKIISEKGCEIENEYVQVAQSQNVKADGKLGFAAKYFNNNNFEGKAIVSRHDEKIEFATEGGYGFGAGVPTFNFSALYNAEYTPNFTGQVTFDIRTANGNGNDYQLTVNGEVKRAFGERPAFGFGGWGRRGGSGINVNVEEGKTYTIEIAYKSSTEDGTLSSLSVNLSARKVAEFDNLAEKYKDAEVIIYVGGITPSQEGEGHERQTIELPAVQQRYLKALRETGKPVVYVNCSGSCIGFANIEPYYDALLQAWYAGQEGGIAIADILFGDYNPCGKLPVTFYKSTDQLPDIEDYNMEGHTYRYFRGEPQYAFGYGLSYTDFQFGTAKLSKKAIKAGKSVTISIPVTNSGKMDGAEVVQVYVKSLTNPEAPIKSLKAYKRVEIAAGAQQVVKLTLDADAFSYYSADAQDLKPFAGQYKIMYGNSSRDMDLQSLDLTVK